jgi:hypothetical protein
MPVPKRKASEIALRRARGRRRKRRSDRRRLIHRRVIEARKEARLDREGLARRLEAAAKPVKTFCVCGRVAGFRGSAMCERCYLADVREEILSIHNVLSTWRITAMDLVCNNQDEEEVEYGNERG